MNETALKERLKKIAADKGITFNECWKQLLLERFLSRVSNSIYADKLIFKGGFLLSYSLKIGRETTDLDFLLTSMRADRPEIQKAFEEIAAMDLEDGFVFSPSGLEELAQPHMNYPGYRITLNAALGKMRDKVQVDLGVGDVVEPEVKRIKLFEYRGKPVFEGEITLMAYPLETIFAEKLEALVYRGALNSRMKDYHDLIVLARSGDVVTKKLYPAIAATFKNRGTELKLPLQFDEHGIEAIQRLWTAHVRGLGDMASDLQISKSIREVLQELNDLLGKVTK